MKLLKANMINLFSAKKGNYSITIFNDENVYNFFKNIKIVFL